MSTVGSVQNSVGTGAVAPVRPAGFREWVALAVLMLPVLLVSVDTTALALALPEISRALHPGAATQLWIVDAYPLVLAALLLVMGALGDRFGRRRLLLIGATGFGLVSGAAAFATSAELLVLARALMAVFGSMLMPSTLALLRSTFVDPVQRRLAIAVWAATFSAGAAIGPLVGGILLDAAGHWGVIFWMAVPVLVPLLALVPLLVAESRSSRPEPVDLPSVALSILAMGPLVLAIKEVATHGPGWPALAAVSVGVVSLVLFVRRQRRLSSPMLDLDLFRVAPFRTSVVINLLGLMTLTGFLFFVSQHLQLVLGMAPTAAALVLLPGSITAVLAGIGVVRVVPRLGARRTIVVALLFSMTAYLAVAVSGAGVPAGVLLVAFVLLGIGVGASETVSNDLILAHAPSDRAGAAAAVSESAYEVGAVLGTAGLGSIITAAYRAHLVLPGDLPAAVVAASTETLGGAVDAAQGLPIDQAEALLAAARAAFESGVSVTAGAMALAMVAAIVFARRGLRGV